jgi:uncharacterized iron-regulated membrane protein
MLWALRVGMLLLGLLVAGLAVAGIVSLVRRRWSRIPLAQHPQTGKRGLERRTTPC